MTVSEDFLQQLAWATEQMPRTAKAIENLPSAPKTRIAVCTHLDIKMVPVFKALLDLGHELFVTTCDPNTVRDEVVQYLKSHGATTQAWYGMSESEWRASLEAALDWAPSYICEFGGELTALYHQQDRKGLVAALEGTGSGIAKLQTLNLKVPVVNWDDLDAKEGLHNRHMVGLTAWQAFCQRTHLTLHEKRVSVLGYGLVGQGVAHAGKAYGGSITVVERDPARALMAAYDGWHTAELDVVLNSTDILVTATGAKGVIGKDALSKLKSGAFVINVGHGAGEISVHELTDLPTTEVMPHVHKVSFEGKHIYLMAGGAMFNLTAGFGDSLNAFDVTLTILASAFRFLLTSASEYSHGLTLLPDHAWKPNL